MNLILVALPETGLEVYGQKLKMEFGVEVHCIGLNLADKDACLVVYEKCLQEEWQVNMLINNVGLGNVGSFADFSYEDIQYQMTLNMTVMTGLTRLFLPQLKDSGNGYILNVSSIAGMFPLPYKTIYAATKSFVYSFSRSMFFELERENVMVSCLCPGPTITNGQVQENIKQLGWKARYFTKSAQQVANIAIDKMLKRKFLIIPGWENKLMAWAGSVLPQEMLLRYLGKTIRRDTLGEESNKTWQSSTAPAKVHTEAQATAKPMA